MPGCSKRQADKYTHSVATYLIAPPSYLQWLALSSGNLQLPYRCHSTYTISNYVLSLICCYWFICFINYGSKVCQQELLVPQKFHLLTWEFATIIWGANLATKTTMCALYNNKMQMSIVCECSSVCVWERPQQEYTSIYLSIEREKGYNKLVIPKLFKSQNKTFSKSTKILRKWCN